MSSSSLSTKRCGMSIAALKSRRIMLVSQLREIFFFALQIIIKLCQIDINLVTVDILKNPTSLKNIIRKAVVSTRDDTETLLQFQYALENKYQHVKFIIELLANTNVNLMQLHDIVISINDMFVTDPISKLFHHLLKHSYIAPIILLEDDYIGSNYDRLCKSVESFADNLLELKDPNTLSLNALQRRETDVKEEEEEEKVEKPKSNSKSQFDLDEIVASSGKQYHRETKQIRID